MTTVFVYEDVTATWAGEDEQSPPAESLLAEGQAMLAAVAADFQALADVRVVAPFRRDFTFDVINPADAELRRHAQSADFTLVIAPETGGRLEHLARAVLQVGGKLLGPSPEAIRLTGDKLALARHWQACGVATPPTWMRGEAPADRTVIVKPRDGAGSQGMFLLPHNAAATGAGSGVENIVQEFVPGFAASVAFLIGPNSICPLIPCAQSLSDDGRFHYQGGRLPIAPEFAERARKIATAAVKCVPGLAGFVGVDVVLGNDGRDWAIEINPRLTTSYVGLRALARFNLAEAMLAAVRGDPLPPLAWRSGSVEWTAGSRFLVRASGSDVCRLPRTCLS